MDKSHLESINKITAEHRVTHFVDISRKCYSLTSFIIANTVKKTDEKAFIDELRTRNGNLSISLGMIPDGNQGVLN